MQRRAFKIPLLTMLVTVCTLALGEISSGTPVYFVAAMMVAVLSIGIAYNHLGGMGTISGILFAGFAARTIVISQFAKVILFERADQNLEQPDLTISIYAVFFSAAMIGVLLYGKLRIRLPKPTEPQTPSDYQLYYWLSLFLGLIGNAIFEYYNVTYGSAETVYNRPRSIGLALSPLLLFAMVVAIEDRMKKTNGKHSLSLRALIPAAVTFVFGWIDTVRTAMLLPFILYIVTCYLRGYRFRIRHYILAAGTCAIFWLVIFPLALFGRGSAAGENLANRALTAADTASEFRRASVIASKLETQTNPREEYFDAPGTAFISRLSLIRADSTIVTAAANGSRYGFIPTVLAIKQAVPSFLMKDKPRYVNAQDYIGRFAGMTGEFSENGFPQFSAVGDSFGAFGWIGVILFPLLVLPAIFVIYESVFDPTRPWGTVAFLVAFTLFSEMMVDRTVIVLFRNPVVFVGTSYAMAMILRVIPRPGRSYLQVSLPQTTVRPQ